MVAPAPEKEAEQVEEKDDSDQPISLAPTISKVDLIKRDLLESAIVTKGKMPIEELKEKGFVKEMANQSLKDFKSFKFEDKSLPSNGNVRKLLKTLTKSVVTPSKKKDVKNIVAKLESAVAEVPQEKNLTPSMMAAVTKNSAARAKKQLFKAKNNAFGHLNSAATRSTPSLRAASAAQRTTKSRLDINLKFDQKMEQPMTPSYLAAKNAKKASEKFVKSAETKGEDRSLAWTPSRKAAQKAEKVTKSMLDFEAILLKRSKQGTALDEPTSKHENHSKENDFDGESFEVENNENSPIFTQTAKEIETVYVSTRRSPRHKRISEIPMGLKLKPMQSSPLRKLIVFDPDEVSPVVFNSPLRNVLSILR